METKYLPVRYGYNYLLGYYVRNNYETKVSEQNTQCPYEQRRQSNYANH